MPECPGRGSLDAWRLPAALLGVICLVCSAGARAASLRDLAAQLSIDAAQISVSGISSGAYMAQQLHVAHSRHIDGAGLIAGGPYRCAAGSYPPYTWFDMTGLYAATSRCSNTNPWWVYQGPPQVQFSVRETRREAKRGAIDPIEGLRDDRVWMLSGAKDKTVPRKVVDALASYYRNFVTADNVSYQKLDGAGHAMITDDFGNDCAVSASPFLSDCDFDAAGELLAHILGPLQPRAARGDPAAVREFDQSEFFDVDDASLSLHLTGHVYVPAPCLQGERCRLHVALHGCQQSEELIGDAFYAEAGYNEWAQTNGIVILYPQVTAWSGTWYPGSGNPNSCWDWWGYSGGDYHTRKAGQIQAVASMINVLVGSALLPVE